MKHTEETQQQRLSVHIRNSDQKTFDDLFREMYPRLVRFAFKITRDWYASCDITQDVFVMLWQTRNNIDPDRSIRSYLYRSVRNRSYNFLRDRRTVVDTSELHNLKDPSFGSESRVSGDGTDPVLTGKLYEWIGELPERQREAFELSRFEGLDHHEIAGVMEISKKTVNNHLTAALKQLRTCYEHFRKASQDQP